MALLAVLARTTFAVVQSGLLGMRARFCLEYEAPPSVQSHSTTASQWKIKTHGDVSLATLLSFAAQGIASGKGTFHFSYLYSLQTTTTRSCFLAS